MLTDAAIDAAVSAALAEDRPWGDLTAAAFLPDGLQARLEVRFREAGVVCGLPLAHAVFRRVEGRCRWEPLAGEGEAVAAGAVVARVTGDPKGLVQGERVALNFLQRLSGVASLTARYVARAREGSPTVRVADTRKTTPGLRVLEKYAVRCGGGVNHRFGLSDGVLVKDNHLAVLRRAGIPLADALAGARGRVPHTCRIEVEVETPAEAREVLAAGADVLLLDNMAPGAMREVVALAGGRCPVEASGNMTLERVAAAAACGVDIVSVGALTHSAPALDIGLDYEL